MGAVREMDDLNLVVKFVVAGDGGLQVKGASRIKVDGRGGLLLYDTQGEGVETIEELNALRDMGARQVQGFYYSRPLSEKALTVYFETPPPQVPSGAARLA